MTSMAQDFGNNYNGSLLESINKTLYAIADRNTDFLKRFLTLNPETPVTSYKHDWVNRPLVGFKDTLNTAINNSTTSVIVNSGSSTIPKRYIAGVTIIDINDERMLVTAVSVSTSTTTLTVTRGVDGTTAAAQSANSQVLIVSAPPTEGADLTRDDSQKGTRSENYTQIFERGIQLSGTAQAVKTAGNEASLDLQAADMVAEILKELQFTVFHGVKSIDGGNVNRRMGGLKYWANPSGGGGQTITQGGAALSFGMIEKTIESYLNLGGDANQLIMVCSVKQQRALNALKTSRVIYGGQTQSETNINNMVERFDFGARAQAEIIYTTDLRDDELYFLQRDRLEVKPLQGRQLDRKPLAKTGDSDREMIVGEYTLEYRNAAETLIRFTGLATPQ